jgi:acetyl-CoA/propionyl-CoA carboxylase biotin carboxyl carrier protein
VRVDAGVAEGYAVPPTYDSLLAKLITYGADRDQARRVMVRACNEFDVAGVPTTLSFHRMALEHPEFVAGRVSTVSVEREWDLSGLPADESPTPVDEPGRQGQAYTVEVDGRVVRVTVFDEPGGGAKPARPARRRQPAGTLGPTSDADVTSPMQGTVVKVAAEVGSTVAAGDLVLVLEAMKMENHVAAHRDGVLTAVHAAPGAVVQQGEPLFTIEPA